MSGLRWRPDGKTISLLWKRNGTAQLWVVDPSSGTMALLFRQPSGGVRAEAVSLRTTISSEGRAGLLQYEWSPSGNQIAFTIRQGMSIEQRRTLESSGILYDDASMAYTDLFRRSWFKPPTELWIIDVRSREQRKVWEVKSEVESIAWAPDEKRIAVAYQVPPVQQESMVFYNADIAVLSLPERQSRTVISGEAYQGKPAWSPDGRSLAFVYSLHTASSIGIADVASGDVTLRVAGDWIWISNVWWTDASTLLFEAPDSGLIRRGKSALYHISRDGTSLLEVSQSVGHISGCSLSQDRFVATCVQQASTVPPDLIGVDLSGGRVTTLTSLNPLLADATTNEVRELRWENALGFSTNGFLLRPLGARTGVRYPLLVIVYGFEGKYALDAEWITSYPVQVLANHGFAVLMVNYPMYPSWHGRNFRMGAQAWGLSPLASLEAAVGSLVAEGLVDQHRVGIMGWSYGCFLAEFAVSHSNTFRVAAVGNGGDYNPGAYWLLGGRAFREHYEQVMGGPPYGATLPNWLQFSPALNADRASAPVLMEFSAEEAFLGLEMSAAFRRNGVPVEFIVYPDEGHVLMQPQHRYNSMQRNLDWFAFWLQGRERRAPDVQHQYQRWRRMRMEWSERATQLAQ